MRNPDYKSEKLLNKMIDFWKENSSNIKESGRFKEDKLNEI